MSSNGHFYFVQEPRSLRSLKWQKRCQFLHFLQFSALASHWHKTNVLCQIMTKLIAELVALNNQNVKLMDVAGNLFKIIQPIYLGNYWAFHPIFDFPFRWSYPTKLPKCLFTLFNFLPVLPCKIVKKIMQPKLPKNENWTYQNL